MGNFLTQAASDTWDIFHKKLLNSFGLEWGIPEVPESAKVGGLAREALNAYTSIPRASNEDISRAVSGRVALSGIGPSPEEPITRIASALQPSRAVASVVSPDQSINPPAPVWKPPEGAKGAASVIPASLLNPRLEYFMNNNPSFWQTHGQAINNARGDINKLRPIVESFSNWLDKGTSPGGQAPADTTPALKARRNLGNTQVENVAGTKVSNVGFNPVDNRTFALSTEPGAVSGEGRMSQVNPNNPTQLADWNQRATEGGTWTRVDDLTPAEKRVRNALDMASNELAQFTRLKPEEKARLLVTAMGPAMGAGGHIGAAELGKEGHLGAAEITGQAGIKGHQISAGTSRANALTSAAAERYKADVLAGTKGTKEDTDTRKLMNTMIEKEFEADLKTAYDPLATPADKTAAQARVTARKAAFGGGGQAPAVKPTWDQFYQTASQAPQNKGKTRQQLLDYYNKNYK